MQCEPCTQSISPERGYTTTRNHMNMSYPDSYGKVAMQVNELIRIAWTVVDCDGNKKAVQLDYATWEELLAFLSDKTGDQTAQDRNWITK